MRKGSSEHSQFQERTFDELKLSYRLIYEQLQKHSQEQAMKQMEYESSTKILQSKINDQNVHYNSLLLENQNRIGQLQQLFKKRESEEGNKYRNQIHKYADIMTEKDQEINSLKKQNNGLKNKINCLQNQIANINSAKDDLQIFIIKHLQQSKNNLKETNKVISEIQIQKQYIQSNYKQLSNLVSILNSQIYQSNDSKKNMQQKYQQLKNNYEIIVHQCINLKLENQKLKDKHIPAVERQDNQIQTKNQLNIQKEIQQIIGLTNIIKDRQTLLMQVAEYHNLNSQLLIDNAELSNKLILADKQIEQYKIKLIPGFQDQLLKKNSPSLFQYLEQKKQQLQTLQSRIQQIQVFIETKDQQVNIILQEIKNKQLGCVCGKEEELQKLQIELQALNKKNIILNDINQKNKKDITSLERLNNGYKCQMKELIKLQMNDIKKKHRNTKKRCFSCFITIDKSYSEIFCSDCRGLFHKECLQGHDCLIQIKQKYPRPQSQSNF